jgi:hypothetical protein
VAGLVAVTAVLLAVAPSSSAATPLFTHSAKSGELGAGRLTLHGVRAGVSWVMGGGRAGVVHVRRLHRRLFLPSAPATGTLHVAGHRGGDEPAFRLSRPRYNRARRSVSYRVSRLNRRSIPRGTARAAQGTTQFGAASLSITPDADLASGDNGGHDCPIGLVNETGYGIEAASESKWDTDTWDPGIPFQALVPSHSKLPTGADTEIFWQSDGGFLRGCSNSGGWVLTVDPNDPSQATPPAGVSFTLSYTYPWDGIPVRSCTSTNPQFTCTPSSGTNYWLLRGPVPCCMRPTAATARPRP